MNASASSSASAAPAWEIVFRVFGIALPSAELTCQFGGVLQSNVDEMVQRRIATLLMRHRHLKLPPSDLAVIAAAHLSLAPAIASAIFDATGTRLRQIPFTPERVWRGLTA